MLRDHGVPIWLSSMFNEIDDTGLVSSTEELVSYWNVDELSNLLVPPRRCQHVMDIADEKCPDKVYSMVMLGLTDSPDERRWWEQATDRMISYLGAEKVCNSGIVENNQMSYTCQNTLGG